MQNVMNRVLCVISRGEFSLSHMTATAGRGARPGPSADQAYVAGEDHESGEAEHHHEPGHVHVDLPLRSTLPVPTLRPRDRGGKRIEQHLSYLSYFSYRGSA